MIDPLRAIRDEAKSLRSRLATPGFYRLCAAEMETARNVFFDDPLVYRMQQDVLPFLYDDYGHGVEHAKKVAIEAAAIILAEIGRNDPERARRLAKLALLAGLLHDICRLEPEHATRGAEVSRLILQDYPLPSEDKAAVIRAVNCHEAFTHCPETPDPDADLLAGALYDADKFRWGPDNFVTTLWEICDYLEWPLAEVVRRFPEGVERIRQVTDTFRTGIGQACGPEFIEQGLELGQALYRLLRDAAARRA
ncbi:MAG: HD domain-containing protein [Thermodesulfobacteriota bacterium]